MVTNSPKLICPRAGTTDNTNPWRLAGLRALALGPWICCLLLAGCVPLHQSLKPTGPVGPPCEPVAQVTLTWDSKVMFLPNFVNGGQPTPALVGRLYLFGPDIGKPVGADGSLRVEVYDQQATAATGQPKLLGQWNVSNKNLKAGLSRDTIGWGYNLALPLGFCPQTPIPVTIRVCYAPKKGVPLYAPDSPINLMPPDRPPPPALTSNLHQPGLPHLPPQQQPFRAPVPTPLPPGHSTAPIPPTRGSEGDWPSRPPGSLLGGAPAQTGCASQTPVLRI